MKTEQGIVEKVLVMDPGMSPVSTPLDVIKLDNHGIIGDSHAGATMMKSNQELPNTRQVSLVSVEELNEISNETEIDKIMPEWIGANILVSGIPNLSKLPNGTKVEFANRTVLIVEEANTACSSAGRAIQTHYPSREDIGSRFPKFALGRRGILAWVEHGGDIRSGDSVSVRTP